jgi:glycosyltransferase involved in cell wall biosynthesis
LKRLLAISWSLPPLVGARSVQVGRTLNALAKKGWKITVFSVDTNSLPANTRLDQELAALYLSNIDVERIPAPFSYKLFIALRAIIPKIAPTPDDQTTWSSRVKKRIRQNYKQRDFDAMLTFGHPWSDHLAGLGLRRAFHCPWVAHFSDPWADNPYYIRLSRSQRRIMQIQEGEVIKAADALVFTSEETVNLVMSKYETQRPKAFTVPHGFDKNIIPVFSGQAHKEKHHLHLVFTGNLYGLRTPGALLQALSDLKSNSQFLKIKVTFVGRIKDVQRWKTFVSQNQLTHQVEFLPPVSYLKSLEFASHADALLLIDAPNEKESVFLPSKLVDYLVFQKPIIGLTPVKGTSAELLRRLGCLMAPPDDVPRITSLLKEILKSWDNNQLESGKEFSWVAKEYDIENTTRKLDQILTQAM